MIKQDTTTRKTLWKGKEMRIFNIIITTKANQQARELEAFCQGWDACKKVEDDSTWSAINPVIHSLKELRNNTWDKDRCDKVINWLKDNFEVKE